MARIGLCLDDDEHCQSHPMLAFVAASPVRPTAMQRCIALGPNGGDALCGFGALCTDLLPGGLPEPGRTPPRGMVFIPYLTREEIIAAGKIIRRRHFSRNKTSLRDACAIRPRCPEYLSIIPPPLGANTTLRR